MFYKDDKCGQMKQVTLEHISKHLSEVLQLYDILFHKISECLQAICSL